MRFSWFFLFVLELQAAPIPPGEMSGLVSLDSCSGALFNPGLPDAEKALVLTAGHCVSRAARLPERGAVREGPYARSGLRIHLKEGALYLTGATIRFATMDGADLALLELPLSFAELSARGARVFRASRSGGPGRVQLRSAHWSESRGCVAGAVRGVLREGKYRFSRSWALSPECGAVLPGFSGTPLLTEAGEIAALVFTAHSGTGKPCDEEQPCEADGSVHPGRVYAQPLGDLDPCLRSRFEAGSCRRRWKPVPLAETPPKFAVGLVALPAAALAREPEFHSELARLTAIYSPIASSHGKSLSLERDWSNPNVLGTEQVGSRDWSVRISGALARHPAITRDALLLASCHELGHQLGGYPFKRDNWEPGERIHSESAEAQADYFATLACARRIWSGDPENAGIRAAADGHDLALCASAHPALPEQDLCLRSLGATRSLARFFSALHQVPAALETPDPREARYSILDEGEYPAAQCRVDTFVAGALCPRQWDDSVIPALAHPKGQESLDAEREAGRFSCFQRDGFRAGFRPRCWYVPK